MGISRRGLRAYVEGHPGFYVVNPQTNIAVSAWPRRGDAEADGAHRDATYSDDPIKLVVVEIDANAR